VLIVSAFGCSDDLQKDEGASNNQGADGGVVPNTGTVDTGTSMVEGSVPSNELEVCSEGWCWFNPTPYGATLQAVHGAGESIFVVGSGGIVLHRSSGRWSADSVGHTDLFDVFVVNEQLAFAAGPALDARAAGYVHRWDGATWEAEPQLVQLELSAVAASVTGTVWAAGVLGTLLRYDP
jgi:hypothetical protein